MKIKQHIKISILGLVAAITLVAAAAQAAEATGTWTWSTPGRNGGADRVSTLTLKAEDAKLTGKLSTPGRDGAPVETQITNGIVEGDKVSFKVVREANGSTTALTYNGTVTADKIAGKIEYTRNGEVQSRDWEAKRADAK